MSPDMTTRFYDLAGIRICVEAAEQDWCPGDGVLQGFRVPGPHWDHMVCCRLTDALSPAAGTCIFRSTDRQVFQNGTESITFLGPVRQSLDAADTRISRQGSRMQVEFLRRTPQTTLQPRLLAGALDLPHLLTIHRGFLLHASFIEWDGRGILFTAPSETGKSTQAQLWCDHAGAELVNGDRAAVRILDGKAFACGIPFSGSSPIRRKVTVPLAAIVCLSQAPENTLQRLRGVRAFRQVWEGCTLNVWDRANMDLAARTVSDVITDVPIYHLACTPDLRAVELLKQTLEVDK